jgi:hypothetical protein
MERYLIRDIRGIVVDYLVGTKQYNKTNYDDVIDELTDFEEDNTSPSFVKYTTIKLKVSEMIFTKTNIINIGHINRLLLKSTFKDLKEYIEKYTVEHYRVFDCSHFEVMRIEYMSEMFYNLRKELVGLHMINGSYTETVQTLLLMMFKGINIMKMLNDIDAEFLLTDTKTLLMYEIVKDKYIGNWRQMNDFFDMLYNKQ